MADHYVESATPFLCFEWVNWHPTCTDVQLVMNNATGVPWLYCLTCRCTAQLDLVAPHITPESSLGDRHAH